MKTNIITNNHYIFRMESTIKHICNDYFINSPINFFAYGKFYKSGKTKILTTCPKVYEYLFQKRCPFTASIPKQIIAKEFCYLISENEPYSQLIADAKQISDSSHIFDLISVENDYYEMFCFASGNNDTTAINYYMNNLNKLNSFRFYFKDKANNFFNEPNAQSIFLPQEMQCNIIKDYFSGSHNKNTKLISTFDKNMIINNNNKKYILFTRREKECMQYLLQGLSIKAIGKVLNISHRTVEYYVDNVKSKLNCRKQTELISIYLRCIELTE